MNQVAKIEPHRQSLIATMAGQYQMDPKAFADTVRATCMPSNASNEDFAAFLLAANQYKLNPVMREIYAFPKKGGGIQPIVGIDGWMTLINTHPACDGLDFEDHFDDKGSLSAVTCRIYRKDRNHPTMVTEYMAECVRPTEPWQKWPARMLRHKAAIQCARYAFGFGGIIDPEEAERSPEVLTGEVVAPPPPSPAIAPPPTIEPQKFDADAFLANLYADLGKATNEDALEVAWDEHDVEATLFGKDEALMASAFEMKKAALDKINAVFPGDK